ncbi:polyhydroxyalkanoate synthesis repressor PhaR [Stenotrophomonas maltophilia]|uniref:polyhydroxyalkanoate synthesis repressor PhaR n=1 Tax=Stenotrophomonas maltophilia TaxID=40324 RepID=UPI001FA7D52E|nr:polyhydroxyalkanoate synthesis repressor PhaR [Stenotrophomonas maltophilia]
MAATRIIKKYPNRRLYDTEISSYITIEDVRQLILDGEDFEVRDAKSGDDLTRSVLLQIIADQEQDGEPMLSTQLLSQLIRFYGDSLQGFMGNYLERSMQVFLDQQQQFRQQMGNLLGQTPWAMMNQLTERNLELWQEFQRSMGTGFGGPRPGGTGTGTGNKPNEPGTPHRRQDPPLSRCTGGYENGAPNGAPLCFVPRGSINV